MIIFQKERVNTPPTEPFVPVQGRAKPVKRKLERFAEKAPAALPASVDAPAPVVAQEAVAAHEATPARELAPAQEPSQEVCGAWRVLPLEGRYEIAYADAFGRPSRRRINAAELKVGPGKLLLGGVDADLDAYRGFRVDRIHALKAVETGEVVDRNIVDWLLAEAAKLAKAQRRAAVAASRPKKASRPAAAAA